MIFINMKYDKKDLERLILIEKKSYVEIGKIYSVSDTTIKKTARKLGIELVIRKQFKSTVIPHNKGTGNKTCLICNNVFVGNNGNQECCSQICSGELRTIKKYKEYLENQNKYCDSNISLKFIKKHILKEQNNRCIICNNQNIWNSKEIIFILDHIDGNANNNLRENLRLVCPNCDSQLDTFKSKNKNSARKERYLKNYKN